jgi:hypothetical protein
MLQPWLRALTGCIDGYLRTHELLRWLPARSQAAAGPVVAWRTYPGWWYMVALAAGWPVETSGGACSVVTQLWRVPGSPR